VADDAMSKRRHVWVNDRGYRVGQDHHSAKLSDHEVELVLELLAEGLSTAQVAQKFEVSERTVRLYREGKRRAQFATSQKRVTERPRPPRRRPARPEEFAEHIRSDLDDDPSS
jgi:FixJ family two-component response regulator